MRVSVICIGNELLMDEGVGPAVARYLLSRYRFPENVEVIDRACMGMAIISDLRACDFALVLDAVEAPDARPGQIFSFAPEDVAPTAAGMLSLHDVRFADVLASADLLGIKCEGHCFGIQVENMSPSEFVRALTPRVAAAMPLLAQAAVRYLRTELGVEVVDLLEAGEANLVLPEVYGEPDVGVMAEYLAASLRAVGANGELVEGEPGCVAFELPEGEALTTVSGAGLAVEAAGEPGRYRVRVAADANDCTCDRFIGSCAAMVEKAGR